MLSEEIERNIKAIVTEIQHEISKSEKKLDKQVVEVNAVF